jgi:hypothetical protein
MSLGLGIFLSTLLLIIVWQVDKRGAWRKFGKIVGWLVVACAVAGYVWWEEKSSE